MTNLNFKKLTAYLVILVIVTIVSCLLYIWSQSWSLNDNLPPPETPHDDVIIVETDYQINPNTILSDLKNGHFDVFTVGTDPDIPLLPSNSILWKGEDYLTIAEAAHEREWGESLAEWHLYSLRFSIKRCQQVDEGIDSAEVIYYQQQGDYYVTHGMYINLIFSEVSVGENYYPYSGKWTPIELNKLVVKMPSEALEIAENNGGRNAREKQDEDGCYISLYLNPDSLFPSFTTNPLNLFGLSWEIEYRGGNRTIFTDSIDPYTGK
jgi:hypothetical protein